MIKHQKLSEPFPPAVFAFAFVCRVVVCLALMTAGAKGVVTAASSYETQRRLAFVFERHPFVVARRNGGNRHDASKFPAVVAVPFCFRNNNGGLDLGSSERRQTQSDNNDAAAAAATGSEGVPKCWRTTRSGVRIVDDVIGNGEIVFSENNATETTTVARVRCETKILRSSSSTRSGRQEEKVVFVEASPTDDFVALSRDAFGVTLLVVVSNEEESLSSQMNDTTNTSTGTSTTTTNDDKGHGGCSGLKETLSGMRVGGKRRVLVPPTTNKVRFVGPGAAEVNENEKTVIMNLQLEALEPPSSPNAILAKTVVSGGVPSTLLLFFRPFLSPFGLFTFLFFVPLIIKKSVNGFAALELLYMDVDADAVVPIRALMEWKLKFF